MSDFHILFIDYKLVDSEFHTIYLLTYKNNYAVCSVSQKYLNMFLNVGFKLLYSNNYKEVGRILKLQLELKKRFALKKN